MKKRFFGTLLMGAFLIASMSMFVSCKDYDDDINKNTSDITALQSQVSTLQTALNQAKSDAAAAHALYATKTELAAKADPSDVAAVKKALDEAVSALSAEVKAMVTADQLTKAIEAAQATLQVAIDGKASQADLDALALKIAAIDPQLNQIKTDLLAEIDKAAKAANDNIEAQKKAIEALEAALKAANDVNAAQDAAIKALQDALGGEGDSESIKALADDIVALKASVATLASADAVKALEDRIAALEAANSKLAEIQASVIAANSDAAAAKADVAEVKTLMNEASENVNKAMASVNLLTVFVNKRLTSLVFDPQFFWGGIEAMEAPMLSYWPLGYTNPYDGKCNGDQVVYTYLNNINAVAYPTAYRVFLPIEASYFMNPSTASVDDITSLSVVSYDKNTYTRAAACNPVVTGYSAKDGILTAKIAVNYYQISNTEELTFDNNATGWKLNGDTWEWVGNKASNSTVNTQEGRVSILAAQARLAGEDGDTTVTSDFAAVAPSVITGFRIVDNAPYILNVWDNCDIPYESSKFHVYTTANNAVNSLFTHKLFWNDAEGIDLDDIVEVHAYRTLGTSGAAEGEFKLEDLKERYGLEFRYQLLEYLSGVNGTQQSNPHATLDPTTHVIKATGINGEQTKASIGREPLVQIELIDTNNDNAIVAIGYIKFQIAAEQPNDVTVNTYTGNAYLLCGGTQLQLSWDQVEGDILANNAIKENGMAKSTFENVYSLSPNSIRLANVGAGWFSGQSYVRVNGIWTPVTGWQSFLNNIITYKPNVNDSEGNQTNVISCELDQVKVRQILAKRDADYDMIDKYGNKVYISNIEDADLEDEKEIEIAARFYDMSNSGYPDVYVPFKLKISKLRLSLNKIPEYWYAANNAKATTGFEDFHVNVDAYGQTNAKISHFQGDLLANLYGNDLQLSTALDGAFKFDQVGLSKGYKPADGYEIGMADRKQIIADGGLKTYLRFLEGSVIDNAGQTLTKGTIMNGASGKKYFVYPASNQVLAAYEWDDRDGFKNTVGASQDIIQMIVGADGVQNTIFKVLETSYLKDLLNYKGHKDLSNSLTAIVGVTVHEGTCEVPVILTNSVFNVKFLRPITATGVEGKKFTDAQDGGNKLNLKDLVKCVDWRDQWTSPNYDNYYAVNKIVADMNGITTNMGGGTLGVTPLSSVSTLVSLTVKNNTGKNGQLIYDNNNLNVGKFKIRVPIIVGYYWGDQWTYVDIEVDYTKANGSRSNAE